MPRRRTSPAIKRLSLQAINVRYAERIPPAYLCCAVNLFRYCTLIRRKISVVAKRGNLCICSYLIGNTLAASCGGRLQFQVVAVNNMPHLNVTNDISATSPAECAKKCFDAAGCKMAGYIPSPSGDTGAGVCLLTNDPEICVNDVQFTPQHASLTPFVVSCLQCTRKYSN